MHIEREIRQFLDDNFVLAADVGSIGREASLTEAGVIDSMGVLELIMYLEERFDILIPDDEMLPENLDSIGRIVAFVEQKVLAKVGNDADQAVA